MDGRAWLPASAAWRGVRLNRPSKFATKKNAARVFRLRFLAEVPGPNRPDVSGAIFTEERLLTGYSRVTIVSRRTTAGLPSGLAVRKGFTHGKEEATRQSEAAWNS